MQAIPQPSQAKTTIELTQTQADLANVALIAMISLFQRHPVKTTQELRETLRGLLLLKGIHPEASGFLLQVTELTDYLRSSLALKNLSVDSSDLFDLAINDEDFMPSLELAQIGNGNLLQVDPS
jgi:hypothetical protein